MSITPQFGGTTFNAKRDGARLNGQLQAVLTLMKDGQWRGLAIISTALGGASEASVSARIRDLRKQKFGGWIVERRYVDRGLWLYRVLPKPVAPTTATQLSIAL